ILDENGSMLMHTIVEPGAMMVYRLPNGDRYAIYVVETAALQDAGWAKIVIYSVNNQPDTLSIRPDYTVSTIGWPLRKASNVATGDIIDLETLKIRMDGVSEFPVKDPKSAVVTLLDSHGAELDKRTVPVGYGIFYTSQEGGSFLVFCDSTTNTSARLSVYEK
ncbi:MAG TPA: hypothetical protein PLO51_06215, partial [Candidatus Micrarchaeota archaeon]|nr:hypothetical protein [Candidatus Micrarchaeota archaeon]